MNLLLLKSVLKLLLPYVVRYFIHCAENKFAEVKSGKNKKAYVAQKVESFLLANNELKPYLDEEKLSILIDDKVAEYINKI